MAAPTETYVDPSIAGNSGTGRIGDPYGDLQYALDTMTRDATNGDRINIKAGTDEILASNISLATYGTPSSDEPLFFQGYTTAAGDGGIGGVSGNGSYGFFAAATSYVYFADMHVHNGGSETLIPLGSYGGAYNVEVNNTTGSGITTAAAGNIIACYAHDISTTGLQGGSGGNVLFSYCENGTKDFTQAIQIGYFSVGAHNVINIDGASKGLSFPNARGMGFNNSIYSNAGTGKGIELGAAYWDVCLMGNIVEGFSGGGGVGLEAVGSDDFIFLMANNYFYNNTTNTSLTAGHQMVNIGTTVLTSSAFIDAANGDFRVVPEVVKMGFPTADYNGLTVRSYLDVGALQRKSFPLVHPGYGGGLG